MDVRAHLGSLVQTLIPLSRNSYWRADCRHWSPRQVSPARCKTAKRQHSRRFHLHRRDAKCHQNQPQASFSFTVRLSCSSSSQVELQLKNVFLCSDFHWLCFCVSCKECKKFRCVAVMYQCKMKEHVFPRMEIWSFSSQGPTIRPRRSHCHHHSVALRHFVVTTYPPRHHRDTTISLEDWGSHTNTQNKYTQAGTQLAVCSHQNMKLFQKWESHLNKWIKAPAAAQRDAQVKQVKQNIWHISCSAAIMRPSVKYCSLGHFSKSNKCVRL